MDSSLRGILAYGSIGVRSVPWAGRSIGRAVTHALRQMCLVCNNLSPHGHPLSSGTDPAPWEQRVKFGPLAKKDEMSLAPYVVLRDIDTRRLLEVRDIDPATGKAKRDCVYCRLLCDIFDAFFVDEWMNWVTETKNGMNLDFKLLIREGAPLVISCFRFTYEHGNMHPRVDLELHTLEDATRLRTIGPALPRNMDSSNDRAMNFAKECVGQCVAEHAACKVAPSSYRPKRLIKVGRSKKSICLDESPTNAADPPLRWASLSHCWGGKDPLKLKRSNLHELQYHIPFHALPQTFKNAITVCRALGVEYLWIDSLCIIQDDAADWEDQAMQMGRIYSESFIVISGASSPDPDTPFLGPRDAQYQPREFVLDVAGHSLPLIARRRHLWAQPPDQGLYDPPFTDSWGTRRRDGPLHQRAWCFQEAYLAKRILLFAPGAIIFECKTHRRSDDQLPPYPITTLGTIAVPTEAEQWRLLVKSFSRRHLTYPSDKLPSVAGLAAAMPQVSQSTYLAGLWSESLLLDLLWQAMPGGNREPSTYPHAEQAAPSWSWASMSRGVTWNPLQDFTPLTQVLDARCEQGGSSPFGKVSGGHITLKGRMRRCRIRMLNSVGYHEAYYETPNGKSSKMQHFVGDGLLVACEMAWPPVDGMTTTARRAHRGEQFAEIDVEVGFFCVGRTPVLNYNYVGLLVVPSPNRSGRMVRIGALTNLPKAWYAEGEEVAITIV